MYKLKHFTQKYFIYTKISAPKIQVKSLHYGQDIDVFFAVWSFVRYFLFTIDACVNKGQILLSLTLAGSATTL